jgi:histidine triad (HIT) family protein
MTSNQTPSVFTKIINRDIPSTIRYEDDDFIAINDINPKSKTHVLVISKEPVVTLEDTPLSETVTYQKLMETVTHVASTVLGLKSYKLEINVRAPHQEVMHLHVHILG